MNFSVQVQATGDLPQSWGDEMATRLGMALAMNRVTQFNTAGKMTGTITRSCTQPGSYSRENYSLTLGSGVESSRVIDRNGECRILPMAMTPELNEMVQDVVNQLVAKLPAITVKVWDSPTATPPAGYAAAVQEKLVTALAGKKGHFEATLIYDPAKDKAEHWLLSLNDEGEGHWLVSQEGKLNVESMASEMARKMSRASS